MHLEFKKLIVGVIATLCLFGIFTTSNAAILSVDLCVYNLQRRCRERTASLEVDTYYALAKAQALANAINDIGKTFESRRKFGLGYRVSSTLEGFLISLYPAVAYELKLCFHYSKTDHHILQSLKNMRIAYLRICAEYGNFYRCRYDSI